MVVKFAEFRSFRKAGMTAVAIALVAVAGRMVGEVVALKLDVMPQEPAAAFADPGREQLRSEQTVMIVAEGLGQVMKQRDHDEFLIRTGFEHARGSLQTMGVDVERHPDRITVSDPCHRGE